MSPDDFLKYFISITAERKQKPHEGRIGASLLFKCTTKWDTVYTGCLSFELPQPPDTGRYALKSVIPRASALDVVCETQSH